MELRSQTRTLTLAQTFAIARDSRDVDHVVGLELRHDGLVGHGEASPYDRYSETPESAREWLERAAPLIGDDPFDLEAIEARLDRELPPQAAARAALEAALHDLVGKRCGQPTWKLLGLTSRTPATSFTLGIDSVEGTIDRARSAVEAGFRLLKVKVGGGEDLARLEAIRTVTDLPVRVDANEGWTVADARALLPELRRLRVELIEQPFHADDIDSFLNLRELRGGIPIVVDEGCHRLPDVARIARYADGLNLKLAKTGGIREALRMIHAARALGLRVMVGCMIESSLGIAAAAQIASLCDYVDLDGHLLITGDPFSGLGFADGAVVLSDAPGLGVAPR